MFSVSRNLITKSNARRLLSATSLKQKILVTGANGQIGLELLPVLREKYGTENVVATDVRVAPGGKSNGIFRYLDVLEPHNISKIIVEEEITTIIHLVAILSATGEANPHLALKVNNAGTENIFELCRQHKLKLFVPSTIAVFGPTSPRDMTPDDCMLRPTTIYGCTKVHAELLGEYYHRKFGLDVRMLRYPGVISANSLPGGGTTDYAVDIYHKAILENKFTCFLSANTSLPMMYMPDLLKATIDLLETDNSKLTRRVYNLAALAFTPKDLATCIAKHNPGFTIDYKPDFRQAIADSWPRSLDDTCARKDWGWKPKYNIEDMTIDVLNRLRETYKKK